MRERLEGEREGKMEGKRERWSVRWDITGRMNHGDARLPGGQMV